MIEFVKTLAGHQLGQAVSVGKNNFVLLADCYWKVADFFGEQTIKEEVEFVVLSLKDGSPECVDFGKKLTKLFFLLLK